MWAGRCDRLTRLWGCHALHFFQRLKPPVGDPKWWWKVSLVVNLVRYCLNWGLWIVVIYLDFRGIFFCSAIASSSCCCINPTNHRKFQSKLGGNSVAFIDILWGVRLLQDCTWFLLSNPIGLKCMVLVSLFVDMFAHLNCEHQPNVITYFIDTYT